MSTVVETLSAVTLVVICLVSHGLLAAGALGVLGGTLLRSPIMVTAAGFVAAAAVTLVIVRRRGFRRRR